MEHYKHSYRLVEEGRPPRKKEKSLEINNHNEWFEMDGEMTSSLEPELFTQNDLPLEAFPIMEELRQEKLLCDIRIKAGEHVIHAHRVVLAATIPYFKAMFTTNMREAKEEEITIQDVDPGALESMIKFVYTGKVSISIGNVQPIMMVAAFLQLNKVKHACAFFLVRRLSPENVIGVRSFAERLSCIEVINATNKYIQKFFWHVSQGDEFLQLGHKDVIEILKRGNLHVDCEEQVFNVAMMWVEHDVEIRSLHVPELLKCIRMPLLSPQFITDHVSCHHLIRGSLPCRDLVDEAKDFYLLPERRKSHLTFETLPRCCDDVTGCIYVVGGLTKSGTIYCNHTFSTCPECDSVSTVEQYDPMVERWQTLEAMKMMRSRVGVAVMRNRLYAVGGFNGSERLNTVEVFDPKSKGWSKVANMNFRRSAVGCCSLNDRLYVCGGYDGASSLNTVECFYPESNKWVMITSMMKHRSAAGVVTLQGFIYAIGGHDGLSIFDSVERYDPQTGQWSLVAPMLTKRCRLGAASLNNKLYCCGGYDGSTFLRSVEKYDPITDTWSEVAPMSLMRSRVALVNNGGKLYAIGGYDGSSNLSTVELYDPIKNTWKAIASMCAHEGGVGAATIPMSAVD